MGNGCLFLQRVSAEKFDRIVNYLVDPDCTAKIDAIFKHWVTKERQFCLQDMPGFGLKVSWHALQNRNRRSLLLGFTHFC